MGYRHKFWILTAVIFLLLTAAGCGIGKKEESSASPTMPGGILPYTQTPSASSGESDPAEIPPVPNAAQPLSPEEAKRREKAAEKAAALAAEMSEEELIYQLLVLYPEVVSQDLVVLSANNHLLNEYPVGGLLLRSQNAETEEQVRTMLEGLQEASRIPMLLMAEEEGGRTVTFMKKLGQTSVRNMFSYRGDGLARAFENARQLADNLLALGVNTDLAPVADVWSELDNRFIGERAYSDDFVKAGELIAEAVKGFRNRNMICTLKYFPGSGAASAIEKKNPIAILNRTEAQLRRGELIPFAAGISAGADMVMIGHLQLPEIDPENLAPFSGRLVSGLLREELGFDGVIVTDILELVQKDLFISPGLSCLKALGAGCDLLLCPVSDREALAECMTVMLAALEAENITRERLEESVIRILTMKILHGIL